MRLTETCVRSLKLAFTRSMMWMRERQGWPEWFHVGAGLSMTTHLNPPPTPALVLTSCPVCLPLGREWAGGGAERGGDMSAGAAAHTLPPGEAERRRVLEPVEKVVTH
ncbi:hypothetical protein SSP24_76860 [Streptomyces spinoverrucosus]|uniref:Uncharacterized protein n=1 Tax=Streptomyces spinoverrucosus TaxID=284043 RepID=A0A4Y3VW81_9ACTN|nr:hypothetical protein SSP24_76860 [Streptomyces spinoverrucosus]